MTPGTIVAERVSRRFRVYPQRNVTLKEAIVRRRQVRRMEIWALRDVSLKIEPGEAVALIGRNGSGKTTFLRLIAGIFKPTSGNIAVGGPVGSLLELGAGFHPEFSGRENVYLSGAIYGLSRRYIQSRFEEIVSFAELENSIDLPVRTYSAGMYVRLGFSIATHLDPAIVLLDEVFAVGDEAFQRKCVARILDMRQHGRTIVFVSHSAAAVERLCERAVLLKSGKVEYDGATKGALALYHRMLAAEEDPAERGAGLREWGSGEVRVTKVRLEDAEGEERRQFLSGEPIAVRLWLAAERPVPPPRLSIEFRDANGSLLGAGEQVAAELGWDGTPGRRTVRFEVPRLPLADGRFQVSVGVSDPHGTRQYHRIDHAVEFVVFPDEGTRGWFRFDGEWSGVESPDEVEAV
jgi:ABC-type polysaccharide/polyol phosphate transport system ATPase subunit